jgi:tripartite-type tricarboxylate transporter receptor subunit TctC
MRLLVVLALMLSLVAHSKEPVKVIVGYGPGGTDTIIRTLALDAENSSNLNFVVENQAGANGSIALRKYFSTNDNKSLLGVSGGQVLFEPLANPQNNWIPQLRLIGPVLKSPLALATAPSGKIKKLSDLFDKSIPRMRINIATAGESHQMLVTIIAKASHHDIEGVRFKGSSDGFTALMGGHVDLMSDAYGFFKQRPELVTLTVAQAESMDNVPSLHKYIADATLVNFFGIAVNTDRMDFKETETAFQAGFLKNNRKDYFEKLGYSVDLNKKSDYVTREVVPTFNKWSVDQK